MTSLDNHCRLCANISRKLQSINPELRNQINLLFQVEISASEADNLPKQICCKCLEIVKNSWIFFTKVHDAQERLEHCFESEMKLEKCFNEYIEIEKLTVSSKCKKIIKLRKFVEIARQIEQDTKEEIVKFEVDEEMPLECCLSSEEEQSLEPSESWPDYPWICRICGEECGDVRGYRKHHCFEIHKRYFCVDCPKVYSRPVPFLAHVSDRHWNRLQAHLLLQCDICQIWLHTKDKQEDHRKIEHPDAKPRIERTNKELKTNNFNCPLCNKAFTSRSNLNFHGKIHTELKEFKCNECGKSYSRKAVFLNHQRIHFNSKEHTCERCGRGFNQRCNLEEHMALHTDARPYVCCVCARSFKTPRCMRKHEGVHSMEKPHVCHVCGRMFKMRTSLRDHLKNHETSKAFECEYCGKAFGLKKVLQVHRRIHTGEQPYRCGICDKRFAIWGHWRQHVKQVHTELNNYSVKRKAS